MARKAKAKKSRPKAKSKAKPKRRKSLVTSKRAKANNRANASLEEGLRETFPGSDPLAITDPTRSIKE
jgi:uncharacterized protein YdaT